MKGIYRMFPVRSVKNYMVYMESVDEVLKRGSEVGMYVIVDKGLIKNDSRDGLYPPIEVEFDEQNKIKRIDIKD